jgi:DNA-binding NtrC family response regulator
MKTVLLIDDEQVCLMSLREIISHLGYQVMACPNAKDALSIALSGKETIDLVITDYNMPEMNGLEFLNILKRILPSVPLIMLTGYGNSGTYLKALGLGVVEFVSKPVGVEELDRIIKAAFLAQDQSS